VLESVTDELSLTVAGPVVFIDRVLAFVLIAFKPVNPELPSPKVRLVVVIVVGNPVIEELLPPAMIVTVAGRVFGRSPVATTFPFVLTSDNEPVVTGLKGAPN
jgi:hypothetical protein